MVQWVRAMSGCFDLTDMPRISFTKLGYIPMIPSTDCSTPWITDKKDSPKDFWAGNHEYPDMFVFKKSMEAKWNIDLSHQSKNQTPTSFYGAIFPRLLVRIIANCHGGDPNWPLDFSKTKKGHGCSWVFSRWNCPVNSVNKVHVHFVWRWHDDIWE